MVSEIIRYVTPLAYMRRTALADAEIGGKTIRKGDKVLMWYVSGNRDGEVIPDADSFRIDRPNARHHSRSASASIACVGNGSARCS